MLVVAGGSPLATTLKRRSLGVRMPASGTEGDEMRTAALVVAISVAALKIFKREV